MVFFLVLLGLYVWFAVVIYCHFFGIYLLWGLLDINCYLFLPKFLEVSLLYFLINLSFTFSLLLLLLVFDYLGVVINMAW